MYLLSVAVLLLFVSMRSVTASSVREAASLHRAFLRRFLYPLQDVSEKDMLHSVNKNAIYNFLHTYYRFSTNTLMLYSVGQSLPFQLNDEEEDLKLLHPTFLRRRGTSYVYEMVPGELPRARLAELIRYREVLRGTINNSPKFNCFGLHEWAMLYSGGEGSAPRERHQKHASLRVSQAVVDDVVEGSSLKCTHFDAFRFFHSNAQPMNSPSPLTRQNQALNEQAGCIHSHMDLFKYAYTLYPLVSSDILQRALYLALRARTMDMAASPYEVSALVDEANKVCAPEERVRSFYAVESAEGRKLYMTEQERLWAASKPVREDIFKVYECALQKY